MLFDLSGKVALVTGAGQNVGAGIARVLAGQGAAVAVNDIRVERAEDTVNEVTAGVARVAAELGPVDILVNNAGNGGAEGMRPTKFRESDPASWRGPIDV